ncbi:hypothetical protein [Microbacterium luticocti]|uniref:hypothetical protein n=1 Tax=Microbacterium luticocti TaxID=451764 RepID=UPI0004245AD0|nr:hypothetical protein [Microbacterium luticocti]
MTAMTTRAIRTPDLTPLERMLLTSARALECAVRRRMARRQAAASTGFDPVEQRRAHAVDAYRRLHLR